MVCPAVSLRLVTGHMQFVGKSSPPMTFRLLILTALKRWSIRRFLLLAMAVPTLPGRRTGSTPSGIVTETGSGSSGGSGKISAWLRSATAAIVSRPSVNLASNRDPAGGLSGAENRRTVGSQSAPIGGTPTGGGRDHSASQTAQEIELRNCRSNRMCTDIFMPIKPAPSEAGGPDFVEGSGGRAVCGGGIDPMSIHVRFGAGDEESSGEMQLTWSRAKST